MDSTGARVGNEEYARKNGSFGVTTLRTRHVRVNGSTVRLRFRGKTGREHAIALDDKRLARIVKRCRDLPGEELFTYIDETGTVSALTSDDVNNYLREIAGEDFSAKDFRTWIGTVECITALTEPAASQTDIKHKIGEALACVAERLGNTPAICRKAYVHPAVLETYARNGRLPVQNGKRAMARVRAGGLSPQERFARRFVERWEEMSHPAARFRHPGKPSKKEPK